MSGGPVAAAAVTACATALAVRRSKRHGTADLAGVETEGRPPPPPRQPLRYARGRGGGGQNLRTSDMGWGRPSGAELASVAERWCRRQKRRSGRWRSCWGGRRGCRSASSPAVAAAGGCAAGGREADAEVGVSRRRRYYHNCHLRLYGCSRGRSAAVGVVTSGRRCHLPHSILAGCTRAGYSHLTPPPREMRQPPPPLPAAAAPITLTDTHFVTRVPVASGSGGAVNRYGQLRRRLRRARAGGPPRATVAAAVAARRSRRYRRRRPRRVAAGWCAWGARGGRGGGKGSANAATTAFANLLAAAAIFATDAASCVRTGGRPPPPAPTSQLLKRLWMQRPAGVSPAPAACGGFGSGRPTAASFFHCIARRGVRRPWGSDDAAAVCAAAAATAECRRFGVWRAMLAVAGVGRGARGVGPLPPTSTLPPVPPP